MMPGEDKLLQFHGVYNTLYSAVTRPDFRFAVTRYFIDEWVPLLGPSLAWLIVGLRQQCFWNQRRNWCIVDKSTLARETALDERTIERCLKKPFSHWFVPQVAHRYQYRSRIGKKVRDKNRYQLLLDEPLSPRHQFGLAVLLHRIAPDQDDSLEAALRAVQSLLDNSDLNDKIAYKGNIPNHLQPRTVLELVTETFALSLADYAGDERVLALDQCCTQLYNLIVQPNKIYMGWQYFRLNWLPMLGHSLAWLVIYLRRHCFWDETTGELRDTLVAYKKDMAAAIGQTPRNLANLLENPYLPLFFTATDPFNSSDGAGTQSHVRNRPLLYRVRMVDEPLTPADQQQVAAELDRRLRGEVYEQNPENGQLNLFPVLDFSSNRQNFAYGQVVEKMPLSEPKKSRSDDEIVEKMPQRTSLFIGKNAATLKDSSILSESEIRQQQQIQPVAAALRSDGLQVILDDLAVQEPVRSKLLNNSDLTIAMVGAWILYADTQPNLRDPHSYIIKRLLANDPPPEKFLAFAKLDDMTWSLFEETAQALRMGQPLTIPIDLALVDTFARWAEVYANLEPSETKYLLSLFQNRTAVSEGQAASFDPPSEPIDSKRDTARNFWGATLAQLQLQMSKPTFETLLKPTEALDYQEDILTIDAKSVYAKDWLEKRLIKIIEATLSRVIGEPTRVRFALPKQAG